MRCPVDFSKAERDVYDNIKNTTLAKMDEVILHESELAKSGMFVNFLQQIESMRLVCNLGLHYHTRHDDDKFIQGASNWTDNAQNFFNIQRRMELISCLQCDSVLDPENIFLDDAFRADPHFSRCLKYTCPNCSHKTLLAGQKIVCGHQPRCPSAPVSLSHSFSEETLGQSLLPAPSSSLELPSKVRALIADLRGLPTDTKWYANKTSTTYQYFY